MSGVGCGPREEGGEERLAWEWGEACPGRGMASGVTGASCGDSDESPDVTVPGQEPSEVLGCRQHRTCAYVCVHVACLCMCVRTCACACVLVCTCVHACLCVCGCVACPSKRSWDQTVIKLPKERKGLCHGLRPQPGWALHPFLTGTLGASTPTQAPPLQRSQPGVPSPPCV